jgi:hypothetical protein
MLGLHRPQLDAGKIRDWRTPFILGSIVAVTFWSGSVLASHPFAPADAIYHQEFLPIEHDVSVDLLLSSAIDSATRHIIDRADSIDRLVPQDPRRVEPPRSAYDSLATTAVHAWRSAGEDSASVAALAALAPSGPEAALIGIAERLVGAQRTEWDMFGRVMDIRARGKRESAALLDSSLNAHEAARIARRGYLRASDYSMRTLREREQLVNEVSTRYKQACRFAWAESIAAYLVFPIAVTALLWALGVFGSRAATAEEPRPTNGPNQ